MVLPEIVKLESGPKLNALNKPPTKAIILEMVVALSLEYFFT